jgi:hypothetical protein
MPIRLRLAVAFALAAAAVFALGGWLFASGLSSAQPNTIDSRLTAQLAQAASPPAGDYLIQVVDAAAGDAGRGGRAGAWVRSASIVPVLAVTVVTGARRAG